MLTSQNVIISIAIILKVLMALKKSKHILSLGILRF